MKIWCSGLGCAYDTHTLKRRVVLRTVCFIRNIWLQNNDSTELSWINRLYNGLLHHFLSRTCHKVSNGWCAFMIAIDIVIWLRWFSGFVREKILRSQFPFVVCLYCQEENWSGRLSMDWFYVRAVFIRLEQFHYWSFTSSCFQFILLGAVPFPSDVPYLKKLGVDGVVTLNEPYETLVPTALYKVRITFAYMLWLPYSLGILRAVAKSL